MITFAKPGLFLLSISLLLASCAPPIFKGQPVFDSSASGDPDLAGMFYQVAWVNHNDLVFLYTDSKELSLSAFDLHQYSFQTEHWSRLDVGARQGCSSIERRWLQKLGVDSVGLFQRCNLLEASKAVGGIDQLRSYSLATGTSRTVVEYGREFHAASYSISPFDGRILQLDTRDQIFIVTGRERTQILTNFVRVSTACWSPVGDQFAFLAAGMVDPGGQDGVFPQLPINSPYDLYLVDSPDDVPVRLVKGVRYGLYLKWSPDGSRLAFRGEVAGQSGIWVYELGSRKLYRVWDQRAFFDWSPDGDRMIVVPPPGNSETVPLLIDVKE